MHADFSVRGCASGLVLAVVLSACGGGGGGSGDGAARTSEIALVAASEVSAAPAVTTLDAFRLADQASFGATEALMADIQLRGPAAWLAAQMALPSSRYSLGNGNAIHTYAGAAGFCNEPLHAGPYCGRDWYSTTPLTWDFYRNATRQPDQLRQRVAFALQQWLVVSGVDVTGTYGLRNYHNALLANAFGNYREVLRGVALSPLMGDYLNNVNNDKAAPNENFARELLQLFSIGTCELNPDGSLKGGACTPSYDNDTIRNYAHALTGWTYPAGGASYGGCWPAGTHCRFYDGDMTPVAARHDGEPRTLLSGVGVPAASTAPQALEAVLDSLMAHPNMAPFIGRQLIQHLVSSNPSAAYVQRVAAAFVAGRHASGTASFGTGQRGDLAATVAAVLLDAEARGGSPARSAGKLREPVLLFTGVLRALGGASDGESLGSWWGGMLGQPLFQSPTVFNYYSPDYPVAGAAPLVGPAFAIHTAGTAVARLNFLTYLLFWQADTPNPSVPGAFGSFVDTRPFEADAADASKLVDRLSVLATGAALPAAARDEIVASVSSITSQTSARWTVDWVMAAAYLVFGSPQYQIQR